MGGGGLLIGCCLRDPVSRRLIRQKLLLFLLEGQNSEGRGVTGVSLVTPRVGGFPPLPLMLSSL